MGSMTDAYESLPLDLGRTQRRALGRAILTLSATLFIISVLAATTQLFEALGLKWWQSRELAGVMGGIAAPVLISGVFILLPSSTLERRLAGAGVCTAFFGVLLFTHYYPMHWNGYGKAMMFPVVSIYFIGAFTSFAAMFFAVSNVRIENHSRVILKTVKETVLDTSPEEPEQPTPPAEPAQPTTQDSGVGFIGDIPTDENDEPLQDDGILLGDDTDDSNPNMIDEYCGNCKHFSYQFVDGERQPYCGLHEEQMDNLDACNQWTPTDD